MTTSLSRLVLIAALIVTATIGTCSAEASRTSTSAGLLHRFFKVNAGAKWARFPDVSGDSVPCPVISGGPYTRMTIEAECGTTVSVAKDKTGVITFAESWTGRANAPRRHTWKIHVDAGGKILNIVSRGPKLPQAAN